LRRHQGRELRDGKRLAPLCEWPAAAVRRGVFTTSPRRGIHGMRIGGGLLTLIIIILLLVWIF
jgi:hypothetical protein